MTGREGVVEPMTEAGRTLLDDLCGQGYDPYEVDRDSVHAGILAIEAEAAQRALDDGLDPYILHHAMRNVARRNEREINHDRDFGAIAEEYRRLATLPSEPMRNASTHSGSVSTPEDR